ncbi:hypothetical protein [Fredinandcohnia sp. 179-A 10B2 NHS]|uniref:hypothetical protein n=1 Tax=Fredinandcohnia sp. 179-A 10B2 NHS TaxID=3235176 RepID=UPI0039A323B5
MQGELIYEDNCIAKQPVNIENIYDYQVKVSIGENVYILQPEESITHIQQVAKNCGDFEKKHFSLLDMTNTLNIQSRLLCIQK